MSVIDREPKRPVVTSPNDDRYWDAKDLEAELLRTFQVCHECRMCVNYCGSFPLLFAAIDKEVDAGRAEGAERVSAQTMAEVSDHCWQCKLCYIKCPYTRDEGAREDLDFPRLMAREKAQRARRQGVPLVDRILAEPRALGQLAAGRMAPLTNFVNASRLTRKVTEQALGISADFPLPPMAPVTFEQWWRRRPPAAEVGGGGQVVLFPTCYGEFNFPEVPQAAALVLEHQGLEVFVPDQLACCGMPALDGGDVASAKRKMARAVEGLLPFVREGMSVVVPGPTCGYTMKREWPEYLGTAEAKEVADATLDLMEFLDRLRRAKMLKKDFQQGLGKVAYHAACHLRAQKIALPGQRLLELLPDTEVQPVERCSAVDGTWGMKAQHYAEGVRYAKRMARAIDDVEADLVVTDCSLAGQRILEQNRVQALHPIQALAQAYGLFDGAGTLAGPSTRDSAASEPEDEEDEDNDDADR